MAGSPTGFHEAIDVLQPQTRDRHRAIQSLMEELEAVDWYDQRVDAADDPELRQLLAHNRDEEKEHAAMLLEWLRRRDAAFAEQLKTYLFTSGSILEAEEATTQPGHSAGDHATAAASMNQDGSLHIGSLRGEIDL